MWHQFEQVARQHCFLLERKQHHDHIFEVTQIIDKIPDYHYALGLLSILTGRPAY